ncbi:MAG TPA: hypothetical protein DC046_11740, partial [Rhodospirillaceae bacterium]|nr:hypothetical protein [Rhodospirillaceae bacterium]
YRAAATALGIGDPPPEGRRIAALCFAAVGDFSRAEEQINSLRQTAPNIADRVRARVEIWRKFRARLSKVTEELKNTPEGKELMEKLAEKAPAQKKAEEKSEKPKKPAAEKPAKRDDKKKDTKQKSEIAEISKQTGKPEGYEEKAAKDDKKRDESAAQGTAKTGGQDVEMPKMALLEVIIIRNESSDSSSRGVNLLESLSLQFEGTLINADYQTANNTASTATRSHSFNLSVPEVEYNLNIVNDADTLSRILARPSVVAADGETSRFFVGANIIFLTGGDYDSVVERDVGLLIKATPSFLTDDTAKVKVTTEFSELGSGVPIGDLVGINTDKANGELSTVMRFGETLAVSTALSFRNQRDKSGVPMINKIPVLKEFFSTRSDSTTRDSLLILLSLRRPPSANIPAPLDSRQIFGKDLSERLQRAMSTLGQGKFPNELMNSLKTLKPFDHMGLARPDDVMPYNPIHADDAGSKVADRRQQFLKGLVVPQY